MGSLGGVGTADRPACSFVQGGIDGRGILAAVRRMLLRIMPKSAPPMAKADGEVDDSRAAGDQRRQALTA